MKNLWRLLICIMAITIVVTIFNVLDGNKKAIELSRQGQCKVNIKKIIDAINEYEQSMVKDTELTIPDLISAKLITKYDVRCRSCEADEDSYFINMAGLTNSDMPIIEERAYNHIRFKTNARCKHIGFVNKKILLVDEGMVNCEYIQKTAGTPNTASSEKPEPTPSGDKK